MTRYQAPNLLAEKPQTKLYVGRIPPTRDNEFMHSLLQVCTDQETTKYLKHYIEKKTESTKKLKETRDVGSAEMNEPVKPPEAAKFGIVTDEDREADRAVFGSSRAGLKRG